MACNECEFDTVKYMQENSDEAVKRMEDRELKRKKEKILSSHLDEILDLGAIPPEVQAEIDDLYDHVVYQESSYPNQPKIGKGMRPIDIAKQLLKSNFNFLTEATEPIGMTILGPIESDTTKGDVISADLDVLVGENILNALNEEETRDLTRMLIALREPKHLHTEPYKEPSQLEMMFDYWDRKIKE